MCYSACKRNACVCKAPATVKKDSAFCPFYANHCSVKAVSSDCVRPETVSSCVPASNDQSAIGSAAPFSVTAETEAEATPMTVTVARSVILVKSDCAIVDVSVFELVKRDGGVCAKREIQYAALRGDMRSNEITIFVMVIAAVMHKIHS